MKANHTLEGLLQVAGNVSRQFEESIVNVLPFLPTSVSRLAESWNLRLVIASGLIDYLPELDDERPNGWPAGYTYANSNELFTIRRGGSVREAIIAEGYRDWQGRFVEAEAPAGVFLHAFGHATDWALQLFSCSPEFVHAFLGDVAGIIGSPLEEELGYFLQGFELRRNAVPSASGLRETFAEVFAAVHGQASICSKTQLMLRSFPRVARIIRTLERDL